MLETSALQQFRPLVVTPSHDGKYFHNCLMSLLKFSAHAHALGMPMQVLAHTNGFNMAVPLHSNPQGPL